TRRLRDRAKAERVKDAVAARALLREIITDLLSVEVPAAGGIGKPAVYLFIGVNGVGKTTTIGKLGAKMKGEGRRTLFAAADTFRAAAAEQLTIWSDRAGVPIIKQHEGADPAAVVFDALSAAKARGMDAVLIDTAGRLHNKQNLMNELSKMSRIIDRECPDSARETYLVLDATTGQNGLIQAKGFRDAAGITGIVLTKLDGTAKGGIVVAIAHELQVPVRYIGVGEGIDDLMEFQPAEFAKALI
ncbi:MAG: signal recognition particle-docking protein FtsY, partial [Pseudoflavonifractor sp.]